MAQIIQEIKVELSKPNFFQAIVAKQFDSGSRFLKVTFVHENEKVSIEGPAEVCINAKRNDGERMSYEGEVNDDGTATVPLTYWMLELVGTVKCDVSVLSGDSRLTTTSFILEVEEASNIPDDVSEDENYDVLLSLIERVENIEKTESTDNKVQEITASSTEQQYPSAKAVYELFSEFDTKTLAVKKLLSDDFQNGALQANANINYAIINKKPIAITSGDLVKVVPNDGYKVWFKVVDNEDLSIAQNIHNGLNSTDNREYTATKDGWLFVQVSKTSGDLMAPDDYRSSITISGSHASFVEQKIKEVANQKQAVLSVTPKHKAFTNIVNNCQKTADWNTHNLSNCEVDTENYIFGNQSIHSTNGAMVCIKNTYDMLNNNLVLKLRINSIATGANLYLQVMNTATPSKSVVYNLMEGASTTPTGDWREITVPYTGCLWGSFDSVDFGNIDYLRIYAEGNVDWNLQYVGTRPIVLDKGIVTFTFDDGYASQGTGLKILAEKGITGTLFYIPEANTNGSDDYLKIPDLQNLVNYYGTDVEVHGASSYNDKTNEELIAHWQETQVMLKENGLSDGKYMSYPNNMHENRVVRLAKRFFESCRTIQYYVPSETYPPADNYRVRAISSIGGVNDIEYVKDKINKAMMSKAWLNLVFHRIEEMPADVEESNKGMYCSENELSEIADYAISLGAYIMNYAEVMESSVANAYFGKE